MRNSLLYQACEKYRTPEECADLSVWAELIASVNFDPSELFSANATEASSISQTFDRGSNGARPSQEDHLPGSSAAEQNGTESRPTLASTDWFGLNQPRDVIFIQIQASLQTGAGFSLPVFDGKSDEDLICVLLDAVSFDGRWSVLYMCMLLTLRQRKRSGRVAMQR